MSMKIVVLLVLMAMLSGCDNDADNPVTKLELAFELKFDGELLSGSTQMYELDDSVKMRFSKVSFYLSDFKLTEGTRSEEHTSELQSRENLVCRLLLEK